MKRLFNRISKTVALGITTLVIIAGMAPNAYAVFGPNRPTKAWNPSVSGFDHVTFNSFTGVSNGIGDERDFLRGVEVGRDTNWTDQVSNVSQNAVVEGKIYIHNNGDARLNTVSDGHGGFKGVAKNVKVRVSIPSATTNKPEDTTAFISADNADPGTIFDTLTTSTANGAFYKLSYVNGSAQLHKGSQTTALSDNLVTSGVNLGDQKGCFNYVQEVTFRMKVQMPHYTIQKQVGVASGTTQWGETATVNSGDKESWLITFKNTGETDLNSVSMVDEVPEGLTVVPGSVKLINSNYPNGYTFPSAAVQANGRQINVGIGNFKPNGGAYVVFSTIGTVKCQDETFVNKAFTTPEGYGAIWDTASVTVKHTDKCVTKPPKKETHKPKELPNTGAGNIVGIFGATTVAGALAHKFWSRKVTR